MHYNYTHVLCALTREQQVQVCALALGFVLTTLETRILPSLRLNVQLLFLQDAFQLWWQLLFCDSYVQVNWAYRGGTAFKNQ